MFKISVNPNKKPELKEIVLTTSHSLLENAGSLTDDTDFPVIIEPGENDDEENL